MIPGGCGHVDSGVTSTEIDVFPVASNAPGRNPRTIWASFVNAELASLTPPITLMSTWPDVGFWLAPACDAGQVQLYGCCGRDPAYKPWASGHSATVYAS